MPVARYHPVPLLETPAQQRDAPGDGQWAQDRHDAGNLDQRGPAALPPTRVVTNVQSLDEDLVGRRIVEGSRCLLKREQAQAVVAIQPVEARRAPRTEAAVRVVEDHQPRGCGRPRHGQARTIICARSGPTLTWLIGTPASASRRST